MARLPYLEADQVAPEYRDMLKRNTNLHKLLVNSPEMARAFNEGKITSREGRKPENTTPTRFEEFAEDLAHAYEAA